MNTRIIVTLSMNIIVHCACLSMHNFELYNSLPFPIYYTVYTKQTKPDRLYTHPITTSHISIQDQLQPLKDITAYCR